jgi:putative membrane protein
MVTSSPGFAAELEKRVGELEQQTSAELVVVISPQSGLYRDVSVGAGLFAAWVALAFACWSPYPFDAWFFPVDSALIGGVVGGILAWSPTLTRLMVPKARQKKQVREAAEASFMQESILGTEGRTGVLIYISVLEQQVELILDPALAGRIPPAALSTLTIQATSNEALLQGLTALGALLARYCPPGEGNANELANAPRMRS